MADLKTGDVVCMARSQRHLAVGERLGRGGQGAVYAAESDGAQLAIKWYRDVHGPMRANIQALVDSHEPVSPAFVWPIDMVTCHSREGFGYVMMRMERRFINCMEMLQDPDSPVGFMTKIKIAVGLVDGFASLHRRGLCYRDISFGNLFVDPASGDVAIIDNDNVGVTGGTPLVKGTPQFMAPEVMLDRAVPTTETDLYSLALFLFYLFCHGHPLTGRAVENAYNCEERDHLTDEQIMLRHYGRAPVFVFDPDDQSNRPLPDDPMAGWWPVYPRFFQDLFIRSFTVGLHDASLTSRVIEGVWREGLLRLADAVWECAQETCRAALIFDSAAPGRACWRCGREPEPPLLLRAPGQELVLWPRAVLKGRHLKLPGRQKEDLGEAGTDPRFPGKVLLRNVSSETWDVLVEGEAPKQVKPGQRLLLRPLVVTIAGKQASIAVAGNGSKA